MWLRDPEKPFSGQKSIDIEVLSGSATDFLSHLTFWEESEKGVLH
jgi:hypothetical protein